MGRWLVWLCGVGGLCALSGCPRSTTPSSPTALRGPRFALEPAGSCPLAAASRWRSTLEALCGPKGSQCRRFRDRKTGLFFCMPEQTRMQTLPFAPYDDPMSFEVRLLVPDAGVVVFLRKDALPPDLPKGALASKWLLRYVESYIQRRGAELRDAKRKTLSPARCRFLHANAAVWAAFPFAYGGQEYWEEALVIARDPRTRYLISIRMAATLREQDPQRLQRLLFLFLHQLRLGRSLSNPST